MFIDAIGHLIERALTFVGMSPPPAVSGAGQGRIFFNGTKFRVSENGGAYTDLAGGSGGLTLAYGDGSDGDLVFDGTTPVVAHGVTITPVAGLYTLDTFLLADNTTVNVGAVVWARNCPIYVRGALTNNGEIHSDGNDGYDGDDGSFPGTGGPAVPARYFAASGTGGDGQTGNGLAGGAVLSSVAGPDDMATTKAGDGGEAAGGRTGGLGAEIIPADTYAGGPMALRLREFMEIRRNADGGTGGGGGAGDGATELGGGGGGGAGILAIAAKTITGTGILRAKGGDGGRGSRVAGNTGGGGGATGGSICVKTETPYASSGQTASCPGGDGGSGWGIEGTSGYNGPAGQVRWCVAA